MYFLIEYVQVGNLYYIQLIIRVSSSQIYKEFNLQPPPPPFAVLN